jgi:hypothetical protein
VPEVLSSWDDSKYSNPRSHVRVFDAVFANNKDRLSVGFFAGDMSPATVVELSVRSSRSHPKY